MRTFIRSVLLLTTSAALLASPASADDAVLTWNAIMQATVTGNANVQGRSAAIV